MEAGVPAAGRRKFPVQRDAAHTRRLRAVVEEAGKIGEEVRPDGGGEADAAAMEPEQEQVSVVSGGQKRRKRMDTREVLRQMEAEGVEPQRMKITDLIWRAEAMERLKAKEDPGKKAPQQQRRGARNLQEREPEAAPAVAPQVQIVNGRIVINQDSLVVSAHGSGRHETEGYTRVEENAPKLNYNSYSNRALPERWKVEDTELFYKGLQQFGTDFALIQQLFPGRTRRQVKAKFKKEEIANPRRLSDALNHRTQSFVYYEELIEKLRPQVEDEVEELVHGDLDVVKEDEQADETKIDEVNAGAGAEEIDVGKTEAQEFEIDEATQDDGGFGQRTGPGSDFLPPATSSQDVKESDRILQLAPESPPMMPLFGFQAM